MTPSELLALGFAFGILAGAAAVLCAVSYALSRRERKLQVRSMHEQRRIIDVI